ncbi:MAG: hypothetical protein ABII90_07700 [Bacteroidota bacterium]
MDYKPDFITECCVTKKFIDRHNDILCLLSKLKTLQAEAELLLKTKDINKWESFIREISKLKLGDDQFEQNK